MKRLKQKGLDKISLPILGAAVGAVLLIIFIVMLFSPDTGDLKAEIQNLEQQLSALQSQLDDMESEQQVRVTQIEDLSAKVAVFNQSNTDIQNIPAQFEAITAQLQNLNERQGNLEKKVAGVKPEPKVKQKTVSTPKKSAAGVKPKSSKPVSRVSGGKYHTVAEKDTYYSIARRYNMKVDELLKMNDLTKNDIIKPNDRLRVK